MADERGNLIEARDILKGDIEALVDEIAILQQQYAYPNRFFGAHEDIEALRSDVASAYERFTALPPPSERIAAAIATIIRSQPSITMSILVDRIAAARSDTALTARMATDREKSAHRSAPVVVPAGFTVEEEIVFLYNERSRLLSEAEHEVSERLPLIMYRYPELLAPAVASLRRRLEQLKTEEGAISERFEAEERQKPELRRKIELELRELDEEVRALRCHEREYRTRKEEDDGPSEDLWDTWQREDRLCGYDPVVLEEFGETRGRMPSLDETEEDHSGDLP
jgi:hypothetical protein